MKNMKKVLAVMTAVSAMAASTSAFAAIDVAFDVENFSATYDVETNKFAVTLTDYTAAEDMTLLILDKDVADEANVQDGEIRYIDQGKAFANAGLKLDEAAEQLAPGSYPVKLGYDDGDSFEIAEATLVIEEPGSGDEQTNRTFKVVWGDTTGDNKVDGLDSVAILKHTVSIVESYSINDTEGVAMDVAVGTPLYENGFIWGNVNNDTVVDGLDSVAVLKATVGISETYTFNGSDVSVDASDAPQTVDIVVPVTAAN